MSTNQHIHVFHEIEPAAYHTPLTQTEAMVDAVRDPAYPYREEWLLALLSSRIGKIGLEAEVIESRPDLDEEDVHQIAALAILEAANSANPDAKTPVNMRIAQEVPRHFNRQLAETKLVPDYSVFANQSVISAEQSISDRATLVTYARPKGPDEHEPAPEDEIILADLAATVTDYINEMPNGMSKAVIELRFGFGEHECHSLRDIAQKLDITIAHARHIERKTLLKLANLL